MGKKLLCSALFLGLMGVSAVNADPIISEVRLGFLRHDAGVISSKKEDGADINAEVLFSSPSLLNFLWSPRPDFGITQNLYGKTSQVYTGVTWQYNFSKHFFGELAFGPSLNDGHLNKSQPDWKDLGSPILFREALSFGVRFNAHSDITAYLDHISNGGLAGYNGGMETLGMRYGYHF